jgi:hypothetical protein
MRGTDEKSSHSQPATKRRMSLKRIFMAGAAMVVAWQVGHGIYVVSIKAPFGGEVRFSTPHDPRDEDNRISVHGPDNFTTIGGGRDNRIEVHGSGNRAVIGGLPPGYSRTSSRY